MANEVEIIVTGKDRSGRETLKGVGDEADNLDRKIKGASPGVAKLRAEFDQTSTAVKRMKQEFARTGDESTWKGITDGENKLRSLKKELVSLGAVGGSVGKEVEKALKSIGDEGGRAFGQGLQSSALQSIKGIATSPVGLAVGVGLAAAISPLIGAAVASGVTVGLGSGVIALGISRAVQDTRVGAAWGDMWSNVLRQLDNRSASFVAPLVSAAKDIGNAFDMDVIPKIGNAFDKLAPRIADLGAGAGKMLTNIFKGDNFDRVMAMADRMLGKLAQELPNIGNAFNNFLGSIADSAPGAEQFWSEFLVGTQRTVVGIGNVIEALSKTYKVMDDFGNHINDAFDRASVVVGDFVTDTYNALDDFGNKINDGFDKLFNIDRGDDGPERKLFKLKEVTDQAGQSALLTADQFGALQGQVNSVAATFDSVYATAVDRVLNTTMSLDQATLGFAESQTRLSETVQHSGTELDIHTAKGQANREAILGAVQANIRNFDAMIAAGSSADQARGAYDSNTAALEHQMRVMGFTQGEIDGMIGKYRSVPGDIKTEIILKGLAEAIGGLNDTLRQINHLDGQTATTYIRTVHQQIFADPVGHFGPNGTGGPPAQAHGGIIGAAASGGPRGNWTLVGEQGRELVKLAPGSQVVPHGQTERMMSGAGRGYDGASAGLIIEHLEVHSLDPIAAGASVVSALKEYERYNGSSWRS